MGEVGHRASATVTRERRSSRRPPPVVPTQVGGRRAHAPSRRGHGPTRAQAMSGSSTTRWARCGCRPSARWGAADPAGGRELPGLGPAGGARLIHALGAIKAAAAEVNAELGVLAGRRGGGDRGRGRARWPTGRWDDQFPVDVFQTGSGTSTNMNANEVIAHLAAERLGRPVHPNDEVNASQSSNDVFPTAIHVAAAASVRRDLLPALDHLAGVLDEQAAANATVVKAGPHPPHGRHPGHARPGARRLRHPGEPGRRPHRGRRGRAWASCPSAAPPPAPGSTPRRLRPGGDRPRWPSGSASTSTRRTTTSPPRARATRW